MWSFPGRVNKSSLKKLTASEWTHPWSHGTAGSRRSWRTRLLYLLGSTGPISRGKTVLLVVGRANVSSNEVGSCKLFCKIGTVWDEQFERWFLRWFHPSNSTPQLRLLRNFGYAESEPTKAEECDGVQHVTNEVPCGEGVFQVNFPYVVPPFPVFQLAVGFLSIFRFGDPELNLHTWGWWEWDNCQLQLKMGLLPPRKDIKRTISYFLGGQITSLKIYPNRDPLQWRLILTEKTWEVRDIWKRQNENPRFPRFSQKTQAQYSGQRLKWNGFVWRPIFKPHIHGGFGEIFSGGWCKKNWLCFKPMQMMVCGGCFFFGRIKYIPIHFW